MLERQLIIYSEVHMYLRKRIQKNLEKLTENVKFVLGDIKQITTNGVQLELVHEINSFLVVFA